MTGVIALLPGYQEGPRIAIVVEGARAFLPVVVVDDGSTDDMAAQADAAGATGLRQVPNAGNGAAPDRALKRPRPTEGAHVSSGAITSAGSARTLPDLDQLHVPLRRRSRRPTRCNT